MTVKEFLSAFCFLPYSVEFYEDGSVLNDATISEVSDWNVDYIRTLYYKVFEPTRLGDKDFLVLRPHQYEVVLALEIIRKEQKNG